MYEHLLKFAQKLPCDNSFQAVLKSYYSTTSKNLEEVTIKETKNKLMCRKCRIMWSEGNYSLNIIPPTTARLNSKMKMIEKYENKMQRTKGEEALLKHLKGQVNKVAKYTCKICAYKTRVIIESPKQKKLTQKPLPKVEKVENRKKKEKSSKKYKVAGLNMTLQKTSTKPVAVLSKKPNAPFVKSANNMLALANLLKKKTTSNTNSKEENLLKHLLK